MARLPADRTKLNAAIVNQQPSIVASAQANREALIEAYDTIDMLYNFTAGLVAGGTLQPYPHGLYRNAIINGGFDICQRGTSFTANGYTADRWEIISGASINVTRQQFSAGQTDVPNNPTYFLRINMEGGFLRHKIEGVRLFSGGKATLSFYARASSAISIVPNLQQFFGAGGSGAVNVPASSLNLSSAWQRFVITFDLPSINGKTIGASNYLEISFGGFLSGVDVDFAQFQLNAGDTPLPFQPRHIAEELELCQRYCRVFGYGVPGIMVSPTAAVLFIPGINMRTTPTVRTLKQSFDLYDGFGILSTTNGTMTFGVGDEYGLTINVGGLSGGTQGQTVVLNTDKVILLDSEL